MQARDDLHELADATDHAASALCAPFRVVQSLPRHRRNADLQALIDAGRGDVPLIDLRFRCSNCGSRLTVSCAHQRTRSRCSRGGPELRISRRRQSDPAPGGPAGDRPCSASPSARAAPSTNAVRGRLGTMRPLAAGARPVTSLVAVEGGAGPRHSLPYSPRHAALSRARTPADRRAVRPLCPAVLRQATARQRRRGRGGRKGRCACTTSRRSWE